MKPKVLVMSGYGINCEMETSHAFEVAGAESEIIHINDLTGGKKKMKEYNIISFPGGFSYGDDTGSGNAFANKIKNNLWEELLEFIDSGKLIIGICNGFQIMTALGLFSLTDVSYGNINNALLANTQNRYECRWVHIKHNDSRCVFTKGVEVTHIPVAHGEGRFHCDDVTLKNLQENKQIVFTYCDEYGNAADGKFPLNPNGARADVAGICDHTGRILGMMPHPERGLYSVNEPDFHLKREIAKWNNTQLNRFVKSNLRIFQNAVDFVK